VNVYKVWVRQARDKSDALRNIQYYDKDLIVKLHALSESHDFMIFEDGKFADIGAVLVNIIYAQVLNFTRLFSCSA